MRVTTPKFIIHECERLIKALPKDQKKLGEDVLRELQKKNDIEDAIDLMDWMADIEKCYLVKPMSPMLFNRSFVSKPLVRALEEYENQKDAAAVLKAIKKLADFKMELWKYNESLYDRTFRLVSSEREWKRLISTRKVQVVIIGRIKIKIAIEPVVPQESKIAEQAYDVLFRNKTVGGNSYMEWWGIWFRTHSRTIYHFYLP